MYVYNYYKFFFICRIAKENLILAGLWYGTAKPDMGLFMEPLANILKQLYDEGRLCCMIDLIILLTYILFNYISMCIIGVTVTLPDTSTVLCRAVLLCTTCDLPARAMILNMINFNGFYSCCFCLQPGMFYTIAYCCNFLDFLFLNLYQHFQLPPVSGGVGYTHVCMYYIV